MCPCQTPRSSTNSTPRSRMGRSCIANFMTARLPGFKGTQLQSTVYVLAVTLGLSRNREFPTRGWRKQGQVRGGLMPSHLLLTRNKLLCCRMQKKPEGCNKLGSCLTNACVLLYILTEAFKRRSLAEPGSEHHQRRQKPLESDLQHKNTKHGCCIVCCAGQFVCRSCIAASSCAEIVAWTGTFLRCWASQRAHASCPATAMS